MTPSEAIRVLERVFPGLLDANPANPVHTGGFNGANVYQFGTALAAIDAVAPELIALVDDDLAVFVASVGAVRTARDLWTNNSNHMAPLNAGAQFGGSTAISAIYRCLKKCPDNLPRPSTMELRFLRDDSLREGLRLDLSNCHSALVSRDWKSCTLVAGSVVEALLLWAIRQFSDAEVGSALAGAKAADPPRQAATGCKIAQLERWHLGDYAAVASHLGVIEANTLNQAVLVRDFRNLIHPGRAQRLQQTCDRGTAYAALAGVERVAVDLQKRFPTKRGRKAAGRP